MIPAGISLGWSLTPLRVAVIWTGMYIGKYSDSCDDGHIWRRRHWDNAVLLFLLSPRNFAKKTFPIAEAFI